MTYGSIFAWWCKHLFISKANIVNCRIVSNQLSLYTLPIDIPNSACGVYRARSYHCRSLTVPVKTCDWGTVVWVYVSQNFVFFVRVCFFLYFPDSKVFCSRGKNIFSCAVNIWDPHYFSWWKFMFEFIDFSKSFVWLFKIEINNVDTVIHRISVIAWHRHLKLVIFPISKGYRIILKSTLVGVNLFS